MIPPRSMQRSIKSLVLLLLFVAGLPLLAQAPNVRPFIQQIANGWTADAKKALPDLLIDHPNDPGVMFLHASLVEDAARAMPLLERIVEAYPKSEWADDALLRIIVYSSVKNNTDKARKSLAIMRDQHGQSDLLPIAADVVRMTVGLPLAAERTSTVKKSEAPAQAPSTPAIEKTPESAATKYSIQTGSYTDKTQAAKLVESFRKKHMKARLTESTFKNKKRYVILVGEYDTEAEAGKDVNAVHTICSCKPFVVKK